MQSLVNCQNQLDARASSHLDPSASGGARLNKGIAANLLKALNLPSHDRREEASRPRCRRRPLLDADRLPGVVPHQRCSRYQARGRSNVPTEREEVIVAGPGHSMDHNRLLHSASFILNEA